MQGGDDEDGEGGGLDIGALLANVGPLIGGLSGVSVTGQQCHLHLCYRILPLAFLIPIQLTIFMPYFSLIYKYL
jgi:hypothetical protein